MFRIQRAVRNFFGFSHAQVNAFLILIPLMFIAICSEPLYHWWKSIHPAPYASNNPQLDSLVEQWKKNPAPKKTNHESHLFRFNPNTVSEALMDSLGFSDALSARIAHYREKGGKFRSKKDLRKIYGMDSSFYEALYPYIDLPDEEAQGTSFKKPEYTSQQKKEQRDFSFDINTADTATLKKIRGIGDKLSLRIVRYREALGGFVSMNQLSEVYGLDTIVVGQLRKRSFVSGGFVPIRLKINAVDERQLAAHPYFRGSVAKAIVSYRFQHGDFKTIADLRKIPLIDEKTIQKIEPYLEFE